VEFLSNTQPIAACFVFDYPDAMGLADLRNTKSQLPSIPLLMITVEHSEAVAVWAFRTRVWDYFVQPLDRKRFIAVLSALRELRQGSDSRHKFSEMMCKLMEPLPAETRLPSPSAHRRKLAAGVSFVERRLETKIMQKDVAQICGLTTFQFSRQFRQVYGRTFQEHLLRLRIEKAKKLLTNPATSVTDICFAVGFSDASYFARAFNKVTGMTPTEFRALRTKDPAEPTPGQHTKSRPSESSASPALPRLGTGTGR
jgi:AraC-like DNA-binding protein